MKVSEARKIADSYNRKKHRKYIIKQYKSIYTCIKKAAKRGESYVSFSLSSYRYDNGLDVPFRLFRLKNPSFRMKISKNNETVSAIIEW